LMTSSLWIWALESRRPLLQLDSEERESNIGNPVSVAFAPDGKTLALIGIERAIDFRDVRTGKRLRQFSTKDYGWFSVLFGRDGKTIAAAGMDALGLWDVKGKEVWRLYAPGAWFDALALSPDGKVLAVGDANGQISLVAFSSGKVLRRWQGIRKPD